MIRIYISTTLEPCIYISTTDGLLILAVYVDDILLAGKSPQRIAQVKADLGKQFLVKDMGDFLGVSMKQNSDTGKIWIGRPSYTQAVLKKFGVHKCHKTQCLCAPDNISYNACNIHLLWLVL